MHSVSVEYCVGKLSEYFACIMAPTRWANQLFNLVRQVLQQLTDHRGMVGSTGLGGN